MQVAEAVQELLTAEGRADPYPLYAILRGPGSVLPVADEMLVVTGYPEADGVLRDPAMFVEDAHRLDRVWEGWRESAAATSIAASMLMANPPDHTRVRRLAAAAFTPRRVDGLRAAVREQATRLLTGLAHRAGAGPFDLMAEFAYPLPVRVICALLGVPAEDEAWFRQRAGELTVILEMSIGSGDLAAAGAAATDLNRYFTALIDERRRAPREDLTTALVRAHDRDGGQLTGEELLANLTLLLVAGFETTANLIGNGLAVLLQHPRYAEALRRDPRLAASYVEELLRYDAPVQLTSRYATRAGEVGGHPVMPGNALLVLIGAANRDPRHFADPDRFDPHRPDNQPLSFGAGAHYCLGAALARLEAGIALPLLSAHRPAPAGTPVRRDRLTLRGYAELPIRFG